MKDPRRAHPAHKFLSRAVSRISGLARRLSGRVKKQRAREIDLIKNSSLFDAGWYLRAYPDVAEAGRDPLRHYMEIGWREGRDPGPDFATSSYLKANRDVASAGVNPLLHFIEFGHEEGRGSSAGAPPTKPSVPPTTDFGPPAPYISFPLADEPPLRWTRGFRLRLSAELFCAGDCVLGYARDEATRTKLETSLSLLATLSGYSNVGIAEADWLQLPHSADKLLDAWYVNAAQLRTRWRSSDFPVVIRAFQHDPLRDGMLCQVGEGMVASPIDALDLNLQSPYFPVLLVMASPEGVVKGARMLPFPSLCRGGAHYSELLLSDAADAKADIDAGKCGELLASRLFRLLDPSVAPAIRRIEVDVRGGDGRGPMFQPEFQLWLSKVFGASVGAVSHGESISEFLAQAVCVSPSSRIRERGAIVRIAHNMAPTIAALVESDTSEVGAFRDVATPFLVAGLEPRQPAIAIEFPRQDLAMLHAPGRTPARFPYLVQSGRALGQRFPAAAIVSWEHREISDAELFVPMAELPVTANPRPAITWAIETRGWPEGGLAQAMHALSLQIGVDKDHLSFVGGSDPSAESLVRERVGGAIHRFDHVEAAIAAAGTPMIGFLGARVLLHDVRTTAVLMSLLDNPSVATVSCAIVNVDQSEANWHATIADGGSLLSWSGASLQAFERQLAIEYLWGSNYPVAVPGPHLWMARKSSLTQWLKQSPGQLDDGLHICSSEVSASYVGGGRVAQLPTFLPTSEDGATRVRAAFG